MVNGYQNQLVWVNAMDGHLSFVFSLYMISTAPWLQIHIKWHKWMDLANLVRPRNQVHALLICTYFHESCTFLLIVFVFRSLFSSWWYLDYYFQVGIFKLIGSIQTSYNTYFLASNLILPTIVSFLHLSFFLPLHLNNSTPSVIQKYRIKIINKLITTHNCNDPDPN